MPNRKLEADLIVNALFDDYGTGGDTDRDCPFVDGRDAILEMKKADYPGWQEVEWAGYHIKFIIQKLCESELKGKFQISDYRKRHLVKGDYVWDARLKASENRDVILGAVDEYTDIIEKNGGIGVLVVDAVASYDLNEDFRRWHEEQKGGLSNYTIERELEGRPVRKRKTAYMIGKILAYFFTLDDIQTGIEEGWLDPNFQRGMRNADGSSRNTKYRLKIGSVPQKYLLLAKNFNEDPEEFKEEFPE